MACGRKPAQSKRLAANTAIAITIAVAGFEESELDIKVENSVLTIRGQKEDAVEREYLHRGIANRTFERKFNLAEHVEVRTADLRNGLLTVGLVREVPEAMKPRSIAITRSGDAIDQVGDGAGKADQSRAA